MAIISDQDMELMKGMFVDELQNTVNIVAFTKRPAGQTGANLECQLCDETTELISEVAELSDKINLEFHEYSSDNQMVKDLHIDKLPAIVLSNDSENGVRYFGIPGGFEFSSFVEDIVDVSRNSTDMSKEARDKVKAVDADVHIQVFVTPTCPYCPAAVRIAHKMAIENPQHITSDAVEAAEFPELINKYNINAVPTVVINDCVQFEGVLPDGEFAEMVQQALCA